MKLAIIRPGLWLVTAALLRTTTHGASLGDALNNTNLVWTTGGAAPWVAVSDPNAFDGVDAVASGTITGNQESWLQTTVVGPGTISFWWRVGSLPPDGLEFYIGTNRQAVIVENVDWQYRAFNVPAGTNTLRWRYVKDALYNGSPDKGWVDQVKYVSGPQPTLQEALNTCGATWTTGGNANPTYWTAQTNLSHDGMAAQSGAISQLQESWMQATVTGATNVSFWWKVSSEASYDFLEFYLGTNKLAAISGQVDWEQKSFALPGGTQTLKWRYVKDDTDVFAKGLDCGWVDQVSFNPTLKPGPYRLSAPKLLPDGRVQLSIAGEVGCPCRLEVSTNLSKWQLLSSFVTTDGNCSYIDSSASNAPARIYRAISP